MNKTSYLIHYGIAGQRWGIRRFQNQDGTLTPEGRKRYGYGDNYNRGNYEDDMRYLRKQSDRVQSHKKRTALAAVGLTTVARTADLVGTQNHSTPILETPWFNWTMNGPTRRALESFVISTGTYKVADTISNKSFEKDKEKILGALGRIQNYQISDMKMDPHRSEKIVSALASGHTKKANRLESKTRDSVYDVDHVQDTKNKLFELKSNAQNMNKKEFMKKLGDIEDTLSSKEYEELDDMITDVYNEKFSKRK